LIIDKGGQLTALVVDEILKTEEIAIKPLGSPLDLLPGLLGAAVLGNGEIVPVLDVGDLPIVSISDDSSSTASKDPARLPSVLIVDDSPSVRHTTMKIVKSAGWDAIAAKDGVEAIEMLESSDLPNIILTDVEMPRMDGYEFVSAIQNSEVLREIPIVFITSRVNEKHRRTAAELGITEYITKPFVGAELIKTMERLCMEPAGAVT
jgi:chemosensory pili system protein ChpA (sensor histidine kinase/response regulator)